MIIETIVTTMDPAGAVNVAPMGVEWDGGNASPVLKPFLETTTYRNVVATGVAVINLIDDVLLFARAAISNPDAPVVPAVVVPGVVLRDACSWREVTVQSIDSTSPRARIETRIAHRGVNREFIGFNRARHAVLEAAIFATRVHLLERDFLESELARLQIIVDKTAGPSEREAMALVTEHIRSAPRTRLSAAGAPPPARQVTPGAVIVEAPARLHFGLLDLRGALGRRFGGVGAGAPGVGVRVAVSLGSTVHAEGDDAGRAAEFARRFLHSRAIAGGARIVVERAIPAHVGLGSGTQLALSVAHALAGLYGVEAGPAELSRAVDRARRSAVGTWLFAGGGLVLEGGRRAEDDRPAPLLARLPFPPAWRCVVAIPDARAGVSGEAEAAAFAALSTPPEREVERVSHLVLMAMLPALIEGDIATFGHALTEVQEINGRWFSEVQGGTFASGASGVLVRRMREWGAAGVGQSSWGPAVYGVVDGEAEGRRLADRVRDTLGDRGQVYEGAFPAVGATLTRGD